MNRFKRIFLAAAIAPVIILSAFGRAHTHPLRAFEPEESIPYRIDYQGWITIDASVNDDGPHDFILDSGATITSVFANLAADQSFPFLDRAPIRILGLASAKALPAHRLGDIKVGRLKLEDHVGVILPDWAPPNTPPQGVIGLDLLTRHTVLIDASARRVNFYAPGILPERRQKGWARTNLIPLHVTDQTTPLYQVNVKVRGHNIPCVVDLGASGTIFNDAAFRIMTTDMRVNRYGLRRSTAAPHLNDIFDKSSEAKAVKIKRLQISKARWRDQAFLVYDAEIFRALGATDKPFCLVGMDLFARRSIIFDFTNEDFFIGPEL